MHPLKRSVKEFAENVLDPPRLPKKLVKEGHRHREDRLTDWASAARVHILALPFLAGDLGQVYPTCVVFNELF